MSVLGVSMGHPKFDRRATDKPWKRSELIKIAITLVSIGFAWATLMHSVEQLHADTLMLQSRTATIERYLIQQSKGQFNPQTEDGHQP